MLFQGYPLAALARLYDHVGQLFDFGCFANVVEDSEGFQILGHAAWRGRSFWIYGVIQAEYLEGERKNERLRQLPLPSCHCSVNSFLHRFLPQHLRASPLKAVWRFLDFSIFHASLVQPGVTTCLSFLRFYPYSLKPQNRYVPGACLESIALWINMHTVLVCKEETKSFYLCLQISICCYRILDLQVHQRKRALQSISTPLLFLSGYISLSPLMSPCEHQDSSCSYSCWETATVKLAALVLYVTFDSYAWFSAREVCRVTRWWCIGISEDAINVLAKHQVTFS